MAADLVWARGAGDFDLQSDRGSGLTFTPIHRTDELYTAFVQDEIALVPERLTLTVGTKLLHTNFTEFEPEPSARLAWTPTDEQTVWAAYTHAVRTPSDAEENFTLAVTSVRLEFSLVGQNLLQPHHVEYVADAGPNVGIERSGYLQLIWTK